MIANDLIEQFTNHVVMHDKPSNKSIKVGIG
jgi:hypothetical protein